MPLRRITNCRPPAKSNETGVTAKMLLFFFPKINATKSKGLDRIRQTTMVGDDTCSQKISERLLSRNIPLSVQLPPRAVKTDHFHSPVRGKSFFFSSSSSSPSPFGILSSTGLFTCLCGEFQISCARSQTFYALSHVCTFTTGRQVTSWSA